MKLCSIVGHVFQRVRPRRQSSGADVYACSRCGRQAFVTVIR